MTDALELERRRTLYNFVAQHPGVNLSTIAEMLKLSSQLVDYHLAYLERHQLITVVKEGGYKRYYIRGEIGVIDKQILSILRQELPLRIVLYLLKHPYSRYRDILESLDTSSPRFAYHLRKLVKNRIVIVASSGEKRGYIVRREKEIITLLIRYKPTSILRTVKETWEEFGPG
jgi:predicted transcriptional regulator